MNFTYEELPIPNKEELKEAIITLYNRDISTVSCSFSSRNYAFIFTEGTHPAVLRIGTETSYRTSADVLCELMWVDDLRNSVPNVCHAVTSLQNHLVERIPVQDTVYLATLFRKANGCTKVSKEWDLQYFYDCGALLGKLHRASYEGSQAGFKYKRRQWDESPYYDFSVLDRVYPPHYKDVFNKVFNRIKTIPKDPRWYGMIHGDFQNTNLFSDWDDLWVFDFDDCCYGYFMFDIACLVQVFTCGSDYSRGCTDRTLEELYLGKNGVLENIRNGYQSEWPLPDEHWELLDDFYRLRTSSMMTINTMMNTFPDFILKALHSPRIHFFEEDESPLMKSTQVSKEIAELLPLDKLKPYISKLFN